MIPAQSAALLVSDGDGEGAIISEFATRRPTPTAYLVRGTKLLASQNWLGQHYRNRVNSAEECERLLASVPIGVLMIDRRRAVKRQDFFNYVEAMLRSHGAEWTPAGDFPIPGDSPHAVAIYRWAAGIEPLRRLPAWVMPAIGLPALALR